MATSDIIYLDYAAATPMDDAVIAAMQPYFQTQFFNPSSPYAPAVQVRRDYQAAKARLAQTFGAKADEIIITAGATESINLAFHEVNGDIVTSAAEHAAVLAVAARAGRVTVMRPKPTGMITADMVAAAITDTTTFVSIQLANHELGTIQPIREISAIIQQIKADRAAAGNQAPLLFHTDASQGFGAIDVHVARLGVDLMTLNAAKIYGPKQVGLLWRKSSVDAAPVIVGGGQERGLRSGTENVSGVMGFAVAAEIATKRRHDIASRRNELQARLLAAFPAAIVSGHPKKRLPNFLHMSFPGIDAERIIFMLETKGVYVATGSACAASQQTKSTVLEAIGMSDDDAHGSLRMTLGRETSADMIAQAADHIIDAIEHEYQRLETGHAA